MDRPARRPVVVLGLTVLLLSVVIVVLAGVTASDCPACTAPELGLLGLSAVIGGVGTWSASPRLPVLRRTAYITLGAVVSLVVTWCSLLF